MNPLQISYGGMLCFQLMGSRHFLPAIYAQLPSTLPLSSRDPSVEHRVHDLWIVILSHQEKSQKERFHSLHHVRLTAIMNWHMLCLHGAYIGESIDLSWLQRRRRKLNSRIQTLQPHRPC